jgi:glycosyltransferase involved in cell wall biosynthesis
MSGTGPLVSVGIPVYNDKGYLREAIDSILGQEYDNLELIISDDASDAATEAICREYAARDPRVRYFRAERNRGAIWNFNHAFEHAAGKYFMWAAYDDVRHPQYLLHCVAALESNPDAVLCCTEIRLIDERGQNLDDPNWPRGIRPTGSTPRQRVRQVAQATFWYDFYGLMRTEVLHQTRLANPVWGFDVVIMLEMCLRGDVVMVPEPLFAYRIFVQKVPTDLANTLGSQDEKPSIPVSWTELALELARSVWQSPLPLTERVQLVAVLLTEFCYRNDVIRGHIYHEALPAARRAVAAGRYGLAFGAVALRGGFAAAGLRRRARRVAGVLLQGFRRPPAARAE